MPQANGRSAVVTLAAISCTAVYLIFVAAPSSQVLFPDAIRAWETGSYPDGLPLRRNYTGNMILDRIFTGYGGFFAAIVDGKDVATYFFALWFLPQLCTMLIFCYWEGARAVSGIVRWPTLVCLGAQLTTAGVTLPLLLASHLINVPLAPNTPLPDKPVSRARMILPAVVLGYLVPSCMLLLPPLSTSLDTMQIISAFWQPFPLYIVISLYVLSYVDSRVCGDGRSLNVYYTPLRNAYFLSGCLAGFFHVNIAIFTLLIDKPAASFAQVFVPYWFHESLSLSPAPVDLAAYRLAGRLLLQHDWLAMTVAAYVFFAWSQRAARPNASFLAWVAKLATFTIVGGPGAAIAWAAWAREKHIYETRSLGRMKNA